MADEPFNYSGKLDFLGRLARDRRLTQAAIAVAAVLVEHAHKETGRCFPSIPTIVASSGVPKTTAIRSLRLLTETGWVTTDKRTGAVTHYGLTSSTHGTSPVDGTRSISGLRQGQTSPVHGAKAVPPTEPEQEKSKSNRGTRSRARPKVTFTQWVNSVSADEDLIPADHAVNRYAEAARIPVAYLDLAWTAFSRRYEDSDKRYADWPRVFQNAVEGDWLRLWRFDNASGQYSLTTAGMQLQRAIG